MNNPDKYKGLPSCSFSLDGKTALVTGATGRLGPDICKGLINAGAALRIIGRDEKKLRNLANELEQISSNSVPYYSVDLFDVKEISSFSTQFIQNNDKLNILVNNAYSGPTNDLEHAKYQQYVDAYKIGVVAAAELSRVLLPSFRQSYALDGDASIINIASMYGMVSPDPRIYGQSGQNSPPYYSSAKAALIHYSQYAAVHLANEGIRVNSISPGPFPSLNVRETNRSFYESLIKKVPMNRIGTPEDLNGPVVFLASTSSRFITGTNLVVDGGWTAW